MTDKESLIYEVLLKAISGTMTNAEAASRLGLSTRQIIRKKKDVKEKGLAGVKHKNTFRKPKNAMSNEVKNLIVKLKREELYRDANVAHYRDLLFEHHDIDISYSTLYRLLKENSIASPLKRRRYKPHRRRKRRPQAGALIQIDASPYEWFGGKKRYSIHGAIDDATSQILGLYMCENECMKGYFEMLDRSINNYGLPLSIYADRHTIFQSPNAGKLTVDEQLQGKHVNDTQFGRAMKELLIELIPAHSAQAKGRVERLWKTLQSRLPVEFKIHGISNVQEANEFLRSYVYVHNSQFAVEPHNVESSFRPLPEYLSLDYHLCIKEQRVIDAGGVFSFYNQKFKVLDSMYSGKLTPKTKINVLCSDRIGVKVEYRSFVFEVERITEPKKAKKKALPLRKEERVYRSQPEDHPWRQEPRFSAEYQDIYDIDQFVQDIVSNKHA